jgi:hypothetical protein
VGGKRVDGILCGNGRRRQLKRSQLGFYLKQARGGNYGKTTGVYFTSLAAAVREPCQACICALITPSLRVFTNVLDTLASCGLSIRSSIPNAVCCSALRLYCACRLRQVRYTLSRSGLAQPLGRSQRHIINLHIVLGLRLWPEWIPGCEARCSFTAHT